MRSRTEETAVGAAVTTVAVLATDPVSRAGVVASLAGPTLRVVEEADRASAVVVVCDDVDDDVLRTVRRHRHGGRVGVVLVVTGIDDEGLYAAVEAGACSLLRRREATPERLAEAVRDVSRGSANLPSDLLGRLLSRLTDLYDEVLEPQGLHLNGMTDRECSVLRLVAQGLTTAEIAGELSYSERTIKNVLQGLTTRLGLRNRAHAVAYAVRHGLV